MSREELVAAVEKIALVLTAEINQPGDIDDRYRALKRAERIASETLDQARA